MTAIAAILRHAAPADGLAVTRMLDAAPHRGGRREVRVVGSCALGIVRLNGEATSTMGGYGAFAAAVAGTPDNVAELVTTLTAAGAAPASCRAGDVVAAAFHSYGTDAPSHFRGPVAGIVTDGNSLWGFRDHLGFRPLFYRSDAHAMYVATEAKQVVAGAGLPREPDMEVVQRIFFGQTPTDLPSALRGVERVPQASVLVGGDARPPACRRYWHPERLLETLRLNPDEVAERFDALFARAVARSLTGDDVVSLSGGVDSPAVAAFAAPLYREASGRPLAALSAVFPNHPAVDELPYIEQVVESLGLQLHTYSLTARPLDDVERWCALADGPVPVLSVPQVDEDCRLARELGFRNILTGEFAEFVCADARNLSAHLLSRGRWIALVRMLRADRRHGRSWRSLARETAIPLLPDGLLRLRAGATAGRRGFWMPEWVDPRQVNADSDESGRVPVEWKTWAVRQLAGLDGAALTLEADEICSAINGVTTRRPFADIDFWEFFLGLPAETKFPDRRPKTLLRRLLRGRVPDAILDRRDKTVFDDHAMSQIDYPTLQRLLVDPQHRLPGVDYSSLATHIERQDFEWFDWLWAKDLARVHAFLLQW
jgi:asparagine synthase (glutamine-hydrolysing)